MHISHADTLSSINYNYYQRNQQLGWHFDNMLCNNSNDTVVKWRRI